MSKGEKNYIYLNDVLTNRDFNYYIIDEPETGLNSEIISKFLLSKIKDLCLLKKTILISTHNNIFGINTNPANYIFRSLKKEGNNLNMFIGSSCDDYAKSLFNNDKINLSNEVFKYFEGVKELYDERKKFYEKGDKKN